jgi:predicted DNA-binding protein with PD1-like motif
MRARTVHEHAGLRTIVAILDTGDEVKDALGALARQEGLDAASFTAIGAFSKAVIRFFDWQKKDYQPIRVDEQVEVASLLGDIALGEDGEPMLHIHVVLGRSDGSALAGDLGEATVRPTLEVVITETATHLRRKHDPETGLPLIRE